MKLLETATFLVKKFNHMNLHYATQLEVSPDIYRELKKKIFEFYGIGGHSYSQKDTTTMLDIGGCLVVENEEFEYGEMVVS